MRIIIAFTLFIFFASDGITQKIIYPEELVNPLMGTDSKYSLSNGNTYPAIALPWGMNFWTPQTAKNGDGWQYQYTANKMVGFKQTHQPSPWINDYGCFSIMPITKKNVLNEQDRASWFSHKTEQVHPYEYEVYLADVDVVSKIAPTERGAIMQHHFKSSSVKGFVIDAFTNQTFLKVIPEKKMVIGYTAYNHGGVPENFKNYFVITFDADIVEWTWDGSTMHTGKAFQQFADTGRIAVYLKSNHANITIKTASSFISIDQAILNLKNEIGDKTYQAIQQAAKQKWNKELSRIQIEDDNLEAIKTFYSCLYRVLLFPRSFYEINEHNEIVHYSPYNGKVEKGYLFTDNGFWDTFRAVFPFFTLAYPSMNAKMMEGLVNTYKESGWLPEWASPGHRDCMIGSNSASIIADSYLKGIRGYDIETLFQAMIKNSQNEGPLNSVGRKGAKWYNELGFVPTNVGINESAARTLEYAYADYCIAALAKKLNKPTSLVQSYLEKAKNYLYLFDDSTKLMRGRQSTLNFQYPFNPFKWGDAFTEGNSWHYTWSVFQDVEGLKKKMGGDEWMIRMLDSVFQLPPIYDESYYGSVIHEIREMQIVNMGQYAHGNQPIQHMIYLYKYTQQPWKADYWLKQVMDKLYQATPDGYCGDEDNGQTSAWYVLTALGFYPVTPASNEYVIGAPHFKKIKFKLENGKTITINSKNMSKENIYVQQINFNHKKYTNRYFRHEDLLVGGEIEFEFTSTPSAQQATAAQMPYSISLHGLR